MVGWTEHTSLPWLPSSGDWPELLKSAREHAAGWGTFVSLANNQMDFIRTERLDKLAQNTFGLNCPSDVKAKPVKLAVLSSSTVRQLVPAIRVAGMRRGIWIHTYECDYGQYFSELMDSGSKLHQFRPNQILFSIDSRTIAGDADLSMSEDEAVAACDRIVQHLVRCWNTARNCFQADIIQQAALPIFDDILGNNENRVPGAKTTFLVTFNQKMKQAAACENVDVLAVDAFAAKDGIENWYDPALWHRAKQEIYVAAAPLYGDLVGRILAARQGRSAKCLVLDLDNTVWGGVVGDDGIDGIVIGSGSPLGEAYLAIQDYAKNLARRGIILAVCSKNDEKIAKEVFEKHPEMLLRKHDIACFVANWDDKANNLRTIAKTLDIGLDALVFLDDNPFERNFIRSELPMVMVPEVPEDPALYPNILSRAGYFEGLHITHEDRNRTLHYRENAARSLAQAGAADMSTFLSTLQMRLHWKRFNHIDRARIVQLINKTNQFNLTTIRYTVAEFAMMLSEPNTIGFQFRLVDRFGDNGIIGILIGRRTKANELLLDTWLMSCRVLGRQVERAMLTVIASHAKSLGIKKLIGEFRPTSKNEMVKEHYSKLGFKKISSDDRGVTLEELEIVGASTLSTFIELVEG